MGNFTIGKLASKVEVNIETIRYYEKRGLVPRPARSRSGYRQYTQEDVKRVLFIKRAKELGFSLREILELLQLRVDESTTCMDVKKRAHAKIADIDEKMRVLKGMKEALLTLSRLCNGTGPGTECPILEALENVENNW